MTVTVEASPIVAFPVEVASVVRLSPTFLRITFTGQALREFSPCGPRGTRDLRIKLLIPPASGAPTVLPEFRAGWYQEWRAIDPAVRGCLRTYTVRRARLDTAEPEIDVDFVLHLDENGEGGPASAWAANAVAGDRLTVIGPNRAAPHEDRAVGIEWRPPQPSPGRQVRILMVGDETAVPAISAVLESLPAGYAGRAVLEVPYAEDFQVLTSRADVETTWLARGRRPHGSLLRDAVRELLRSNPVQRRAPVADLPSVDVDSDILWEVPDPADGTGDLPFYAWIAGEAATVRDLRRFLVQDVGVDRRDVAFMGYWRQGRAEPS